MTVKLVGNADCIGSTVVESPAPSNGGSLDRLQETMIGPLNWNDYGRFVQGRVSVLDVTETQANRTMRAGIALNNLTAGYTRSARKRKDKRTRSRRFKYAARLFGGGTKKGFVPYDRRNRRYYWMVVIGVALVLMSVFGFGVALVLQSISNGASLSCV